MIQDEILTALDREEYFNETKYADIHFIKAFVTQGHTLYNENSIYKYIDELIGKGLVIEATEEEKNKSMIISYRCFRAATPCEIVAYRKQNEVL